MKQTLNIKHSLKNAVSEKSCMYFCSLFGFYTPSLLLEVINSYKQKSKNINESGGLAFSTITEGSVVVERISFPSAFDMQTRHSFQTNKRVAELLVEHESVNCGGVIQYMGEWHTPPEDYPYLSNQDAFVINAKHKKITSRATKIVMLIQGRKELGVWCYDGKNILKLQKL